MEIRDRPPTRSGSAEMFIGETWIDEIAGREPGSHIRVNVVRFAPGARNGWHAHALGQTLHVTDGIGRVQSRDGEVVEVRAGDTVYAAPWEWHWHGAGPDHFMTHLAIWEAPAEGPESEWGQPVSDAEYLAPARPAR